MVSLRALRRAMAAAPAAPPPPADAARPLRVGLLYDERMCAHETPDGEEHPENPERLRAIWRKLNAEGITSRCVLLKAKEAEDRYIASVHSQDHIKLMKEISSKQYNSRRNKIAKKYNSIYFNQGSSESAVLAAGSVIEGSSESAVLAAGSVIEVAEKVAAGELTSAIALVRPPGHHAEHDKAMGFCLFNNVAVAANYLLNERPDLGIKKILIVDWDVHHGNATQKMFYDDPRVLVFSVHRFDFGDFYPYEADASYCFIGEEAGKGYNINVPWEQGKCGDADYIATWDHILLPVTEAFDPDIILVSAGFDAALGDPLGGCCITPNGYARLLTKLLGFAQGRIVMTLEGGYNLRSTANSVFACAKVLLGDKFTFNSSGKQPFESTWRVIQEVRNELKTCWPVFSDKLQERPVMEGRTAGPSMTKSVPDLDTAEAAAGLNAQDVIVSPADEGEVAPGFGPLPDMQVPCPDDAASLLEGGGAAAERILAPGDIIATTNAGAAADSTAPSGREVVEGRGAPVNVDAGERRGDRGTLGLDRPGVPTEFVSAVEDENRLWLEHHQLGTSIQNALLSVLELHQNRGLQLHEKLRDIARAKVSYITSQHAYIHEMEQKNALLGSEVDQARVVINDMGNDARSRGDALVRAEKERDAQRSAAAERALEVEHLNALLQERDVSLAASQSQLLQERQAHDSTRALLRQQNEAAAATEAQLRLEEASVTRLSEVLVERSVALEVLQSTAQEQETSLATEKEQAEGLRTTVADALARAKALEVAYSSSQQELEELKEAAMALCQEYEEDGAQSGSSLASRLRSLGGRIVERVKNTFLLGIRKTLGVVSTHYIVQLDALATGYIVAEGLDDDAAMAATDQADANVAETAVALATLFADEILPGSGEGDEEVSAERTVEGDGP